MADKSSRVVFDICIYAMDYLSKTIQDHLKLTYGTHRNQRPHDKYTQMTALRDKTCVTLAENHINNLRAMVNSSNTSALLVNNANLAYNFPYLSPSAAADAASIACSSISRNSPFSALASRAGKTIELNTPIPYFEWAWGNCLGYNRSHRYRAKDLTDIICPNRNRPGVAEAAA